MAMSLLRNPGAMSVLVAAPSLAGLPGVAGDEASPEELREAALDLLEIALDLSGCLDPTPASDGASAALALARGRWLDALISGVSMVPYVGDLAKLGKLPHYARSLERAMGLARRSRKAARALRTGFRKLLGVLELFPARGSAWVARMRNRLRAFLREGVVPRLPRRLPDISRRFRFRTVYELRGNKEYKVKEAWGRLGVPGKVKRHRSRSAQTKVSRRSGDHAGHLIGDQFGAPGDARNLSLQNHLQNKAGGSWHGREQSWAKKLEDGVGIEVHVSDSIPAGGTRPTDRVAKWVEIYPDGSRRSFEERFINQHSADWETKTGKLMQGSRSAGGVKPTVPEPQKDNAIHVDFVNKRRLTEDPP
jgi:hypothetical protein